MQSDMTVCAYAKSVLAGALGPSVNTLELSNHGAIALLMRGNRVKSIDKDARSARVKVLSGIRAGCDCWLSLDSVIWNGNRVKGRGVVEPGTVCLARPEEFDTRFYLPGCCRDAAYKEAVKAKPKLTGVVRVIDGASVQVRPPPFETYVWRVTGTIEGAKQATCWVPVDRVDLDDPDDFERP